LQVFGVFWNGLVICWYFEEFWIVVRKWREYKPWQVWLSPLTKKREESVQQELATLKEKLEEEQAMEVVEEAVQQPIGRPKRTIDPWLLPPIEESNGTSNRYVVHITTGLCQLFWVQFMLL
jgi:hypothetical protein